jgi:hypothetical protein
MASIRGGAPYVAYGSGSVKITYDARTDRGPSTERHRTAPYGTVRHRTAPNGTVRHRKTPYGTVKHRKAPYGTPQENRYYLLHPNTTLNAAHGASVSGRYKFSVINSTPKSSQGEKYQREGGGSKPATKDPRAPALCSLCCTRRFRRSVRSLLQGASEMQGSAILSTTARASGLHSGRGRRQALGRGLSGGAPPWQRASWLLRTKPTSSWRPPRFCSGSTTHGPCHQPP